MRTDQYDKYDKEFENWFNENCGNLATEYLDGEQYDKEDHLALIEGNHAESEEFYKWCQSQFDEHVSKY